MNSESASEDFDHIQGKFCSLVWFYFLMITFINLCRIKMYIQVCYSGGYMGMFNVIKYGVVGLQNQY